MQSIMPLRRRLFLLLVADWWSCSTPRYVELTDRHIYDIHKVTPVHLPSFHEYGSEAPKGRCLPAFAQKKGVRDREDFGAIRTHESILLWEFVFTTTDPLNFERIASKEERRNQNNMILLCSLLYKQTHLHRYRYQ